MNITRRTFLRLVPSTIVAGIFSDALAVETNWINETHIDLTRLGIDKKIIHFSDLHYNGDRSFAENVVNKINGRKPDYVVFTGDFVEERNRKYLSEGLEFIKALRVPTFGILGNHDPRDSSSKHEFKVAFRSTGGDFLINERVELDDFVFHGVDSIQPLPHNENKKKILLCHYPAVGDLRVNQVYDLILSGHSHGGQIRIPLLGAPVVPLGVGRYIKGLYESKIGILYVNAGVGTSLLSVRFLCRPEITEILI